MNITKPSLFTNLPRYWSDLAYAGVSRVPAPLDPDAGSWPLYFLKRNVQGEFTDLADQVISFAIRYPDASIDFTGEQLNIVKQTLQNLTPTQIAIAR